ncbi:hypothetical protein C6H64_13245 [Photorhabdus luminescens]|uniref:Uncharacterized protein n=1 Tax=Photorhabdus aegyptia TaxID=2805098 RepID=A0A022PFV6_9GAMM|nr:hypothetical protein [Photorhabdus aegyptia]EYU15007.1 hypothetical protein BA1DRAFT_02475 [Photorhabdus aegyptia]PQQ29031.1 hypothetical protein C6H64_13245 [Photorhabdus luminescens]PQQ33269.1 hypothetical protein C6H69_11780 [Photorhabdus luminescens]
MNNSAISASENLVLSYLDGRQPTVGIENINKILFSVGVRVSTAPIPEEAKPILEVSKTRALTGEESEKLISLFSLHRGELLEQIRLAGRQPEAHRGGFLSISEIGVAPYPKVYDMKAISVEARKTVLEKFGKLHVNSSEDGMGIDEVMTVVAGGPWTWFFRLPDGEIVKLSIGRVETSDPAWRLSYPGLGMHAGFLDAKDGLLVAFAHGPKHFVMRYDEPSVDGTEMLGTNPWIDFSGDIPKLVK